MKEKKRDGETGGKPRGSRKNIVGSESQGLLQAAAGSGFIGFSAFQTQASPSSPIPPSPGALAGGAGGGTARVRPGGAKGSAFGGGKRGIKTAKADGGYSPGALGQVLPPHYAGGDSHLAVVSKRLSKRDTTTKLKALAELRAMCRLVTKDPAAAASSPVPPAVRGARSHAKAMAAVSSPTPGETAPLDATAPSAEDLGGLAPHWVFMYQRLSTEGDRRTREAANATLLCMLKANRRAFQPLMQALMGAWWCSQADTATEVSISAKKAFDDVFPEMKRTAVLTRCAGSVLKHIAATLHQTPEMMLLLSEASGCTPEEAVKRAERLTVSALIALSNLLEALGAEGKSVLDLVLEDDTIGTGGGASEGRQEAATYSSVLSERLWVLLEDPRLTVRRATYSLVSSCCRHARELLLARPTQPEALLVDPTSAVSGVDAVEAVPKGGEGKKDDGNVKRRAGEGRGGKRARVSTPPLLVRLLSEDEASNHREAWQAVLLVLREFKDTWAGEKGASMVLPTLLKRLRKGAFLPTSGSSYPCLLPFLASLPVETLLAPSDGNKSNKRTTPFCADLVETLWGTVATATSLGGESAGGLAPGGSGAAERLADVSSAHIECVTLLLLKLPPPPPPPQQQRQQQQPSPEGLSLDGVNSDTQLATSVSVAAMNLARAIGSFVLDAETAAAEAGVQEGVGGRERHLRGLLERAGKTRMVCEALGRALGQLHLGGERGAGVMGSVAGAEVVWGRLLVELAGALDERSASGVRWMGNVLGNALSTVKGRHHNGGGVKETGVARVRSEDETGPSSGQGPFVGGLRDMCRALFHHCVGTIGFVSPGNEDALEGHWDVSRRDIPLLKFMSTMAAALGMEGIFCMGETLLPSPDGVKHEGHAPNSSSLENASGGDAAELVPLGGIGSPRSAWESGGLAIQGVLSRGAATEFYQNFLVPRLLRTAGGDGGGETAGGVAAASAVVLESLTERFLLAGGGPGQGDHFRFLLDNAFSKPGSAWLQAATTALRLAPPGACKVYPEVEGTVLRACGVPLPATENSQSQSTPPISVGDWDTIPYLPPLVEACLGVASGRASRAPFIGASAASRIVDAAIVAGAGVAGVALESTVPGGQDGGTAHRPEEAGRKGRGVTFRDQARAVPLALLEGLLGVVSASERKAAATSRTADGDDGDGGGGGGDGRVGVGVGDSAGGGGGGGGEGGVGRSDDGAMAAVLDKALPLLLASFSGCGQGREADRVWRDCGAPALAALAFPPSTSFSSSSSSSSSFGAAGEPYLRKGDVWQEFSDGAVEVIRRIMEGGDSASEDTDTGASEMTGTSPSLSTSPRAAERAANLTLALVELEKKAVRRRRRSGDRAGDQPGDRSGEWSGDRCGERAPLEESTAVVTAAGTTKVGGSEAAPVLWRLGLTRPSTWQNRREEAFSRRGAGAAAAAKGDTPTAIVGLAQACVGSRWAWRWECAALVLDQFPDARARLAFLVDGVEGVGPASGGVEVAGEVLHEIIAAGVMVGRAARLLEGKGYGGLEADDDGVVVDIPPGLLIPFSGKAGGKGSGAVGRGAGGRGELGGGGGGSNPAEEFGLGLPSFRSLSFAEGDQTVSSAAAAAAAVAAAGVLDTALSYLGKGPAVFATPEEASVSVGAAQASSADTVHGGSDVGGGLHPLRLLLPRDLWQVAFEPPLLPAPPAAGGVVASSPPIYTAGGDPTAPARRGGGRHREENVFPPRGAGGLPDRDVPAPMAGPGSGSGEDERLHGVVLSALRSAVEAAADSGVVSAGEEGAEEVGAWRASCSAEVSTGLLVSVVGEAFARGLGLGDEANRLMAFRCGTYSTAPSTADLAPGAKTLYTTDGQAVTVVAAHADSGGGEDFYTVRPVTAAASGPSSSSVEDAVGREKQTLRDRLFLLPPVGVGSSVLAAGGMLGPTVTPCPWLVRPAVSAKLAAILGGPLSTIEERLWQNLGRSSSAGSGPDGPVVVLAAAVGLRGCASTCLRAALMCADDGALEANSSGSSGGGSGSGSESGGGGGGDDGSDAQALRGVVQRITAMRNRWASAAVRSGSAMLAGGRDGGAGDTTAAATVALTATVLSGFFAATPLMPSQDEAMRLFPARLRRVLSDEATTIDVSRKAGAPREGWARAQTLSGLVWLRDSVEASSKVHSSPSCVGSVSGSLFAAGQADAEATVVALVKSASARRRSNACWRSPTDLALARACAGLLAGEGCSRAVGGAGGEEAAAPLSAESKTSIVSWAVSKFLLSGGRVSSGKASSRNGGDDTAICLETARLLTGIAWDCREEGALGVGSSGGLAAAAAAGGVEGRRERRREGARLWAAAREPAVWRGLHAAVVGAVRSPTLQLCAFEVLEAAATGWDCGLDSPLSDDEVDAFEGGSGDEAEPEVERQSIVSRLAAALGGWGVALPPPEESNGVKEVDESSGGDEDGPAPATTAQEEAKEQQDDLELIARCFPEDLLLAVEALPVTIDQLAHAQHSLRKTRLDGHAEEDEEEEDEEEEEEEEDEHEEEEYTSECEVLDGDLGAAPEKNASDNDSENVGDSDNDSEETVEDSDDHPEAAAAGPSSNLARESRRKRLNRRRSELNNRRGGGLNSNSARMPAGGRSGSVPGGYGGSRRRTAGGPPLLAPFLTWLLWLEHCKRASELEDKARSAARAFLMRAGAIAPILKACFQVLKDFQGDGGRGNAIETRLGPAQAIRVSRLDPRKPHDLARLALAVYFRTVHVFPSLSRSWWADDCARGLRVWAAEFTKKHVSPALIEVEAQIIADATERGLWDDGGEMRVRCSANSRQVVASYVKDECTLEAIIQLPPEYPLRNVEVSCSKRMGVSESRWKKWVLQIVTLLSLQDGSVLDAVMLWKKNVDKEFEGVEPCVICYGILHPRDMALPQMTCKTCKNRFHSSCLYKWFHTSHKNKCPICQQTWA